MTSPDLGGLVLLDILDFLRLAAEGLLRQRGFHEPIDVAVEHGGGVIRGTDAVTPLRARTPKRLDRVR